MLFERCERKAEAIRLRVAVTDPVVVSPGVSLAIAGPPGFADSACRLIEQDLARRGVRGGRCRVPKS